MLINPPKCIYLRRIKHVWVKRVYVLVPMCIFLWEYTQKNRDVSRHLIENECVCIFADMDVVLVPVHAPMGVYTKEQRCPDI